MTTITPPTPIDLVVQTVNSPASAILGETVSISWTALNDGVSDSPVIWRDAVYLSLDQIWISDDVRIGDVDHQGVVGPGATYSETLTAPIPPAVPGDYYVLVRADVRNQVVEGTDGELNNTGVSLGQVSIDAETLFLGQLLETTINQNQEKHYRVAVPAGEDLSVTALADTLGSIELFVNEGSPASRATSDFVFSEPFSPAQETLIPSTESSDYFILVRGSGITESSAVLELTADVLEFGILGVSPRELGVSGFGLLRIRGSRLSSEVSTFLSGPSGEIEAVEITEIDSNLILAIFLLDRNQIGDYDVALLKEGTKVYSQESISVLPTNLSQLTGVVSGPSQVRPGNTFSYNYTLANTGTVDLSRAIIEITSQGGDLIEAALNGEWPEETIQTDGTTAIVLHDFLPRDFVSFRVVVTASSGQNVRLVSRVIDVPRIPFRLNERERFDGNITKNRETKTTIPSPYPASPDGSLLFANQHGESPTGHQAILVVIDGKPFVADNFPPASRRIP